MKHTPPCLVRVVEFIRWPLVKNFMSPFFVVYCRYLHSPWLDHVRSTRGAFRGRPGPLGPHRHRPADVAVCCTEHVCGPGSGQPIEVLQSQLADGTGPGSLMIPWEVQSDPHSWMVCFMEHANYKWRILGGSPNFRTPPYFFMGLMGHHRILWGNR